MDINDAAGRDVPPRVRRLLSAIDLLNEIIATRGDDQHIRQTVDVLMARARGGFGDRVERLRMADGGQLQHPFQWVGGWRVIILGFVGLICSTVCPYLLFFSSDVG